MNRAPALLSLFGFVLVASIAACSAKHEDHPPILTECGESCGGGGGGSGGTTTPTDASATPTDSGVDDSQTPVDAGLSFDAGLGLTD